MALSMAAASSRAMASFKANVPQVVSSPKLGVLKVSHNSQPSDYHGKVAASSPLRSAEYHAAVLEVLETSAQHPVSWPSVADLLSVVETPWPSNPFH